MLKMDAILIPVPTEPQQLERDEGDANKWRGDGRRMIDQGCLNRIAIQT